jgi:methylase of polypeptide subunit release factors
LRKREQRTHVEEVIDDLRKETEPHRVRIAELDLTVLPGVLSPRLSHAPDALMARWTIPPGAEVLDLGCGSGVLGFAALSQGASRLVALDVNPVAVETANLNIRDLGYAERAEARLSDTYSALEPGETFDVIVFAAPYWDREAKDDLEKSCYDPGYAFFTLAVQQAHHWLRPGGSMYIIFSDQGDVNKALAAIQGGKMRVHATHLMRPSQPGGHIRIIWELRAR